MSERNRLTTNQRMEVIALLARGDTQLKITQYVEDQFGFPITVSAIAKIKSAHKDVIKAMQDKMLDAQAADAEAVMKRARAQINRRLFKSELDGDAIAELDEQYRNGDLSRDDYRKKKTGLLQLSIAELTRITLAMHTQNKTDPLPPEAPALPSGGQQRTANSPSPQLEGMLAALQKGDTVTLQQIVFGKGVASDKSNSVPAEPTPVV